MSEFAPPPPPPQNIAPQTIAPAAQGDGSGIVPQQAEDAPEPAPITEQAAAETHLNAAAQEPVPAAPAAQSPSLEPSSKIAKLDDNPVALGPGVEPQDTQMQDVNGAE